MNHSKSFYASFGDSPGDGVVAATQAGRKGFLTPKGVFLPSMAGGAGDAVTFPLGPATVSGTTYTVDFMLQDTTRVTRLIANLALQRYFVDRIFAPAGQITGGAVIYDQATTNELFATRDVGRVEPGREFPVVTFDRGQPLTAQVEKFGGKFPVTDEARRRNNVGRINRAALRLANTITRKLQQRALAELQAAITAFSRTATGVSWTSAMALTISTSNAGALPGRDFARVQRSALDQELGYEYNLAIMNPAQWEALVTIYQSPGGVQASMSPYGITDVWVTPRKAAGSVYFVAQREVGELGYEVPLSTETWRDPLGRQQDWYQSSVLPVVYVTDPYAILEVTGV